MGSSAQYLYKDRKGVVDTTKTGAVIVCVQSSLQHIAESMRDSGKNLLVVYSETDYIRNAVRLDQKNCVLFHFVILFSSAFKLFLVLGRSEGRSQLK